ncbi:MAG: hypothetical protein E1N59_1966 [Puniceicoccaceae bacterium 5H]|nr:MAG: hypothetical protein E1N59_1966 [Puniceicoccaceae bacterium 5H]
MNAMQPLIHWFQRMSLRERLLLVASVWVLLLVWLWLLLGKLSPEFHDFQRYGKVLDGQERKLTQAEDARQSYEQAIMNIDPQRTYNASQLFGRVDELVRDDIPDFDINRAQTESSELFNFYRVRLSIDRASLEDLIAFDEKLKAESPYLTLTSFTLRSMPRDPRQLDATFEIASFELKTEALQSSN